MLLTGATGFLGARLLLELLKNTATPIYCLIRANSESDAFSRLTWALKPYQNLLPDHWQKRVLICCGDLTLPQLGLTQASWNELSQTLGAIYHSGARVNQILPYTALAPTNLQGTQTLAKLAWTGKVKPLHYLSTLSVFVATDQNQGLLLERDDLSTTQAIYGGYAQSKWAAEIWLRQTGQDYPLAIYRLGLITGDSVTGYSPERDWLRLLSLGLLDLGYLPQVENSNLAMDITPVDVAAENILKLSFQGPLQTYHLANAYPLYLSDYLAYLQAHYGLASLPLQGWLTHLKAYLEQTPELAVTTALLALCRQLSVQDYTQYRSLDLFQRTNLRFDMRQTLAVLPDFACPPPDAALLTHYFKAFHGELLEPPQRLK